MATSLVLSEQLEHRLEELPNKPGIYLMKDGTGTIIYVGKASNLRHRVRSYFQSPETHAPRIRSLVNHIVDIECLVVQNELEAFMLESNYIKQHHPRYNVRLRDDKQYPYLRITLQEDFPRVERVRHAAKDGARYFGPFASSKSMNETLSLIKRLFPYRSCDLPLKEETIDPTFRACLELHIHRCLGPCNATCTRDEYNATMEQVVLFLEGRQELVVRALKTDMETAAEALDFERATRLRDQIRSVERVIERQRVVSPDQEDLDAVGLARDATGACIELLLIRQGKLISSDHYQLDAPADVPDGEVLTAFLRSYYERAGSPAPDMLLPTEPEDADDLQAWIRALDKGRITLAVPKRGHKHDIVSLASDNAQNSLAEERAQWLASKQRTTGAAGELASALNLPRFPHRIECYDNSNIQGSNPVAAMIVFIDGQPAKSEYRKFKVTSVDGPDDFRSMGEVLRRRFARALRTEGAAVPTSEALDTATDGDAQQDVSHTAAVTVGWAALPDLVIVDGGKGQLSAALGALEELGLTERVPIVALAKQQEELFLPGHEESILLPRTSPALHLVQRIRDETHRFAITFHRQQRKHAALGTSLDAVTGIGPKKRQALIRKFGSPKAVAEAPVEELITVPGITPELAHRLKLTLGYV